MALPCGSNLARVPRSPVAVPARHLGFFLCLCAHRIHTWVDSSSTKSPPTARPTLRLPPNAVPLEPRRARRCSAKFIGTSVREKASLLKDLLIDDRRNDRLVGLSKVSLYHSIRHHPKRASMTPIIPQR